MPDLNWRVVPIDRWPGEQARERVDSRFKAGWSSGRGLRGTGWRNAPPIPATKILDYTPPAPPSLAATTLPFNLWAINGPSTVIPDEPVRVSA